MVCHTLSSSHLYWYCNPDVDALPLLWRYALGRIIRGTSHDKRQDWQDRRRGPKSFVHFPTFSAALRPPSSLPSALTSLIRRPTLPPLRDGLKVTLMTSPGSSVFRFQPRFTMTGVELASRIQCFTLPLSSLASMPISTWGLVH